MGEAHGAEQGFAHLPHLLAVARQDRTARIGRPVHGEDYRARFGHLAADLGEVPLLLGAAVDEDHHGPAAIDSVSGGVQASSFSTSMARNSGVV